MMSSSKWWWSIPGRSLLSSMTLTMVSSFNLLSAVVNDRKELSHSVSNQWPHINTSLLPPPRGNYAALLPPLLIMCLRQFSECVWEKRAWLWVRKKDSGHSRINHRADWAVAHRPLSPRGLKLLFIYLFIFVIYFFVSKHLPLSFYPLHFIVFLLALQCISLTEQTG